MRRNFQRARSFATLSNQRSVESLIDRVEQGSVDAVYTTLAGLLGSCTNAAQVNRIHRIAARDPRGIDRFLGNQLLQMYVKMGDIVSAAGVFSSAAAWSVVSWTCMVAANARFGDLLQGSILFHSMLLYGTTPDKIALLAAIQLLRQPSDLYFAKNLQGWIDERGLSGDLVLGNALIGGYSRCESLDEARRAFDRIRRKDSISWNSIIAAHVSFRQQSTAVTIFRTMLQESSSRPDASTIMAMLATFSTPADLPRLERFHSIVIHDELVRSDAILGTALLTAYAKSCGCLAAARSVFYQIDQPDLVAMNAMIAAFAHHHRPREAIELFHRVAAPDRATFLAALGSIDHPELLADGFILHTIVASSGYGSDLAIATALVDMYAKCGDLPAAREVFDSIHVQRRDLIAWNAMISGYARGERFAEAMEIFRELRRRRPELAPTRVSIAAALTAVTNLVDLESGMELHDLAASSGIQGDVSGLLIYMYAACGDLDAAKRVFDEVSIHCDLSSWNSMITAYTDKSRWDDAIDLVHQMHHQGVPFDDISFVTALNACAAAAHRGIPHGMSVHRCVAEAGREDDVIVRTALINMYGKCGELYRADEVFTALYRSGHGLDTVAWNAMGSALAQHEEFDRGVSLYRWMLHEGVMPDEVSFVNALAAAAGCTAGNSGATLEEVHSHVVQRGLDSDVVVSTVLVAAYGAAQAVHRAESAFSAVPPYRRDVVLWNAMIDAYGGTAAALRTYAAMDIAPDKLTLILALNACATMAETAAGEAIHRRAVDLGFHRGVGVTTALIHMYGSCGRLDRSLEIFGGAQEHTSFMWNALVSGFARRGESARAIGLFRRMQQSGFRADAIGFVTVLGACSQAGFIATGCDYFASLLHDHGIVPYREHYSCMVDLFGRAGRMEEAVRWVEGMPAEKRRKGAWEALLGACSIHSDVERGRKAAEELFGMRCRKSSPYVIMAKLEMLAANRGSGGGGGGGGE